MAIASFEKHKIGFWNVLYQPLGHLFRYGHSQEDFFNEVGSAPMPAGDSDWPALPLYILTDYLTHEHREFRLQEITDIAYLFDVHIISHTEAAEALGNIYRAFQDFLKCFHAHVE